VYPFGCCYKLIQLLRTDIRDSRNATHECHDIALLVT
jgi:hypothetical protein